MNIQSVFEKNRAWVDGKISQDSSYFADQTSGQQPPILYIGCSDSRVPAEVVMGAGPGEVFVHRNVANVISNLDMSATAVINYAVSHLKVKHVVVCGHYYCGGVKAAMGSDSLGPLDPWLKNIRDVYRLHKAELDAIAEEDDRYNRLIELNVLEQCLNTLKNADVQAAYEAGNIEMHGWVYDIGSGKLIDLGFDIKAAYEEIKGIMAIQ